MLIYRITHKSFSTQLTASGLKGRWNNEGKKVIYCAESIALAFLENMVRRQSVGFNNDFKIMVLHLPDNIEVTYIPQSSLKEGWKDLRDYSLCQPVGDEWYNKGKTLLLKAPSVILPGSFNCIINAEHADYKKVELVEVSDLVPDQRIEDILKRYKAK